MENYSNFLIDKIKLHYKNYLYNRKGPTLERKIIFFKKNDLNLEEEKDNIILSISNYIYIIKKNEYSFLGNVEIIEEKIHFNIHKKNYDIHIQSLKNDFKNSEYFCIIFHNKLSKKTNQNTELHNFIPLNKTEWLNQMEILNEKNMQFKLNNEYLNKNNSNQLFDLLENYLNSNEFSNLNINDFGKLISINRQKNKKTKIIKILEECANYKSESNEKINKKKSSLLNLFSKELENLISKKRYLEIYSNEDNENKQIEKLINVLLEENLWILGYDENSKINSDLKKIKGNGRNWKPDLIIKNKDGTNDFFELKKPSDKILHYDSSHQCYYFGKAISKGLSQMENQMSDYIYDSKLPHIKNDTLYFIIGNKENEINQKISKEEKKIFITDDKVKEKREQDLQLLRNSFKNMKIIFYDEL